MVGAMQRVSPRRERGAVAVEFALVLPLLLILVFGLIQYGLYFWSVQGGSSAVREAARRAAVGQLADCNDFRTYVQNRIGVTSQSPSAATITRKYFRVTGAPVPVAEDVLPGDVVTVTVQFKSYDMNFPFVPFVNDGIVYQAADSRVEYIDASQPEDCT